jgi:hypothetical protein
MTLASIAVRCPAALASGRSRFVIRIPYYIADGRKTETRADCHIEGADKLTRLWPLPRHRVTQRGETGRKTSLSRRAGTIERARIPAARLRHQPISFGLLPACSPIAETARYLHGNTSVNPLPRWGSRRFPRDRHAPDKAHFGRHQLLGTRAIARNHQHCNHRQLPISTAFHRSHPLFSGPYRRTVGIREKA